MKKNGKGKEINKGKMQKIMEINKISSKKAREEKREE
jgi:hypothetical protein